MTCCKQMMAILAITMCWCFVASCTSDVNPTPPRTTIDMKANTTYAIPFTVGQETFMIIKADAENDIALAMSLSEDGASEPILNLYQSDFHDHDHTTTIWLSPGSYIYRLEHPYYGTNIHSTTPEEDGIHRVVITFTPGAHDLSSSPADAYELQPGNAVVEGMGAADDIDWYTFTIEQEQFIRLSTENLPGYVTRQYAEIDLFTDDMKLVATTQRFDSWPDSNPLEAPPPFHLQNAAIVSVLPPGNYLARLRNVYPPDDWDRFQALQFRCEVLQRDGNDSPSEAVAIEADAPFTLPFHAPVDWLTFTVSEPASLELDMGRVFDQDGTLIGSSLQNGCLMPGTYFVAVEYDYGNPQTLRLAHDFEPVSIPVTPATYSAESFTTPYGSRQRGLLKFSLTETTAINIHLHTSALNGIIEPRIYDIHSQLRFDGLDDFTRTETDVGYSIELGPGSYAIDVTCPDTDSTLTFEPLIGSS